MTYAFGQFLRATMEVHPNLMHAALHSAYLAACWLIPNGEETDAILAELGSMADECN